MGSSRRVRGYRSLIALVLSLFILLFHAIPADADEIQSLSADDISNFNIMLVIDGSGSLVMRNGATDPEGIRYDAIDLFLALLPNEGNLVGAIVFDDNTQSYLLKSEMEELDGKSAKLALSEEIRGAGTGGDTDIGTALLDAVKTLEDHAADDTQSVVILFSDGRTDLGDNEDAYKKSLDNKESAIVRAQEAGIPIMTICLHANDVADPEELREIAERTSGKAVEVTASQDLGEAFEQFYNLIFHTSTQERIDVSFPSNGELEYDVPVPTFGAKEVNVISNGEGVQDVTLISPAGPLSSSQIDEMQMTGGSYRVVKLSDPMPGTWNVILRGEPGSVATVNVVYNIDTSAMLSTADGCTEYKEGDRVELIASLMQKNRPLSDPSIAREYKAEISIMDLQSGHVDTFSMQPDGSGSFSYVVENGEYSSYEASARLYCESLELRTGSVQYSFGNTAPSVVAGLTKKDLTLSAIVTPVTGRRKSLDVTKFFQDDQDTELTYTIESSQLVADTAELVDGALKVNTAKSKSGDVVIRATDSQGAYEEITVRVKTTNLTLPIILLIVLGALAALIIPTLIAYLNRPSFKGVITMRDCQSGDTGIPVGVGDFRGSIPLTKFAMGNYCGGFDAKKCKLVAQRHGGVRFVVPKKQTFFIDGQEMSSVELMIGRNQVYTDENKSNGLEFDVKIDNGMYGY